MHLRNLTAVSLLVLAAGCTTTQKFHVSVKNNTDAPITVGLVKEGDPYQKQWASPEQAAIKGDRPSAEMWAAVPPGRTVDAGEVEGRFRRNARAVLRVYKGDLNLAGILAVSRDQPERYDLTLQPGPNHVIVFDREGQIIAVDNRPEPKSPAMR